MVNRPVMVSSSGRKPIVTSSHIKVDRTTGARYVEKTSPSGVTEKVSVTPSIVPIKSSGEHTTEKTPYYYGTNIAKHSDTKAYKDYQRAFSGESSKKGFYEGVTIGTFAKEGGGKVTHEGFKGGTFTPEPGYVQTPSGAEARDYARRVQGRGGGLNPGDVERAREAFKVWPTAFGGTIDPYGVNIKVLPEDKWIIKSSAPLRNNGQPNNVVANINNINRNLMNDRNESSKNLKSNFTGIQLNEDVRGRKLKAPDLGGYAFQGFLGAKHKKIVTDLERLFRSY